MFQWSGWRSSRGGIERHRNASPKGPERLVDLQTAAEQIPSRIISMACRIRNRWRYCRLLLPALMALARSGAGEQAAATATPRTEERFWSLEPLRKPELPQTKLKGWAKSPIDFFILAKLEDKGM